VSIFLELIFFEIFDKNSYLFEKKINNFDKKNIFTALYPVHLLVIPMHICASQSLFSHSYVVNECRNRHCNVQIDIGIRADELGIGLIVEFGNDYKTSY
jgi:hypothetical protein